MSHPKGHVDSDYLQLVAGIVAQYKQRTYALMHVEPGHTVLDVGCGPGTDTIPLAEWVGDTGQVVGVDYDEAMIAEADQRAQEAGVGARVVHRHADATALPFESATFDAARSERLFQHLPDPEAALAEMVRVTRSGGWIVVLATDWSTLSADTTEVEIEQRLKRFRLEHCVHNAFAGRQLYRLFKERGLVDLAIEMCPIYVTDYALGRRGALLDEVEEGALAAGGSQATNCAAGARALNVRTPGVSTLAASPRRWSPGASPDPGTEQTGDSAIPVRPAAGRRLSDAERPGLRFHAGAWERVDP